MEAALKRAAERMGTPATEFGEITAKMSPKERTVPHRRRLRLALIALAAVVLLAGTVTAYGVYKVNRGTWTLMVSHNMVDAKIEMKKYGITLPEEIDGYGFREMSVGSSVPHGVSYFEAIFSGYKSVHVDYGAEDLCYTVAVGDTKDAYWITYFGYDSEELWSGDGGYLAVEYRGYVIHTGYYTGIYSGEKVPKATWVDEDREICVSVHGYDGRDPLQLAKMIIDALE